MGEDEDVSYFRLPLISQVSTHYHSFVYSQFMQPEGQHR